VQLEVQLEVQLDVQLEVQLEVRPEYSEAPAARTSRVRRSGATKESIDVCFGAY
jgi:hypothetical protein